MPLYEYECEKCGHRFEKIQRMSDAPPPDCPACGGGVHKLQSAPAFQFKGSGWYITDYARKDKGGESKDKGGEAKTSGSTSTDDKAASKDTGSTETKDSTKSEKSTSSSTSPPAPTSTKAP